MCVQVGHIIQNLMTQMCHDNTRLGWVKNGLQMGAGGCGVDSYGCGGVRGTGGARKQDKKRHRWSWRHIFCAALKRYFSSPTSLGVVLVVWTRDNGRL